MEKTSVDILWVTLCSLLVFSMQAGFLCLEAGLCRSKNSINIAIKNLLDLGVSVLVFWVVGFGIMFGLSSGGVFGTSRFLLDPGPEAIWTRTFFLYQAVFCTTAVTILSGAVAERMRFGVYCVSAAVISSLIYPVIGHWCWGGTLDGPGTGWLSKLGFYDFAGSTVVHSVGGWIALAALLHVGARTGRFPKDKPPQPIPGSNVPLAVHGCLILLVGWFGFNGGSAFGFSSEVPRIIINTLFGSCGGLVMSMLYSMALRQRLEVPWAMNGALAGCVAVTANCSIVSLPESVLIGAVGGVLALWVERLLEWFRIDDPVGAIPVHLAAGVWGSLAVGLFGDLEMLGTGRSRLGQIGVQLVGIGAAAAWAFCIAWVFFLVLSRFTRLRVTPEEEMVGLNVAEHGATTETADFMQVMQLQAMTGDLRLRVPEEPFTEIGLIARYYNHVMQRLEKNQAQNEALFKSSMDGIIVLVRETGQIVSVNHAVEDIFGVSADRIEGQPVTDLVKIEDVTPHLEDISIHVLLKELSSTRQRWEIKVRKLDGSTADLRVFATDFSVQGQNYYSMTVSSLAVETAMRRDLQVSREERKAVLRGMLEGVVIIDELGQLADFNSAARSLFRLGDKHVGSTLWDQLFPKSSRDRVRYGIARLIANVNDPAIGKAIRTSCLVDGKDEISVDIVFQRVQVEERVSLVMLARGATNDLVRQSSFESLPF